MKDGNSSQAVVISIARQEQFRLMRTDKIFDFERLKTGGDGIYRYGRTALHRDLRGKAVEGGRSLPCICGDCIAALVARYCYGASLKKSQIYPERRIDDDDFYVFTFSRTPGIAAMTRASSSLSLPSSPAACSMPQFRALVSMAAAESSTYRAPMLADTALIE